MVGFESLQVCFVCMQCIIARTFIYITAVPCFRLRLPNPVNSPEHVGASQIPILQVRPAEATRLPGLGRMVPGGARAPSQSVSRRITEHYRRPFEIPGRLGRIDGRLFAAVPRYPRDRAVRDQVPPDPGCTTRYALLHRPYAHHGLRKTMTRRTTEITTE